MTLHCLFIQKEDAEFGVLISRDEKSGESFRLSAELGSVSGDWV